VADRLQLLLIFKKSLLQAEYGAPWPSLGHHFLTMPVLMVFK